MVMKRFYVFTNVILPNILPLAYNKNKLSEAALY